MAIVATHRIIFDKTFDCDQCKKKFPEGARIARGCHGSDHLVAQIGKAQFTSCPGNFYDPMMAHAFQLWTAYQQGIMPYEGALQDQPAQIIEIFNLFAVLEKQRHDLEAIRKKIKVT